MNVDKSLFPELFEEQLLPWGPIRAVLELDVTPPDELISNVNFVPCVNDKWVIVKHENGWCIVGGTLEPGEGYLDTIKRELMEEAGAVLKTFHLVGAWHCHSLADKPYRPHLPWPEFYRLLAYGRLKSRENPRIPRELNRSPKSRLSRWKRRVGGLKRKKMTESSWLTPTAWLPP